jgi:hypothetical protein
MKVVENTDATGNTAKKLPMRVLAGEGFQE